VLRHARLEPAEVRVLRPGVHAAKEVARRQPGQALSIVCAGELNCYEPFAAVLEAFAALRQRREDCLFFFIGAGRAERSLRRRSEQLGLVEGLTFVAPLPPSQMAGIFKAADVLVYPHSAGMLEMEVLQAMAAGTCVLTGGPCVGDFVIDSETVLGYDAYSTEDLDTKLDVLLSDPDAAASLARSALEYLRAHHSPASMVAEAVEIYRRQALNGRTLKLR
jgi:D-inositol-3-phosphate glycosyltransferase